MILLYTTFTNSFVSIVSIVSIVSPRGEVTTNLKMRAHLHVRISYFVPKVHIFIVSIVSAKYWVV